MASVPDTIDDDEEDAPMQMSKGKRPDEEMDITPMIDITFLLLIFFVVASKMDPTQTGRTPTADAGLAVSAKDSAVIFVERGSEDAAILSRSDKSKFIDDEDAQTLEVIEYVQKELDDGKQQVMILGDYDVSVGEIGRVRKMVGDNFPDLDTTYIAVKEE
ncbi:Biopolymer transport protein ExbD/TolR [Roseimaritima multifibrata]|uniref:Biopolymer transport protein ExbD/TolR n=1 Tax=Roseimaritima multifibrata TaxID=1930274 RepID=A0A517MMB6_9BACT|nr:biopolymer transporter ExbD [Roseimaritima multifibrata]QDS95980.1 Biopolymer transport protein ExbD/TolR [Roseimaritima multifibrata]